MNLKDDLSHCKGAAVAYALKDGFIPVRYPEQNEK